MSNGYPTILREGVLTYIDDGHRISETSRVFKISRPTIMKWVSLRAEGDYGLKERPARRYRKIKESELKEYVKNHPDSYLKDIGRVFGVSSTAIIKAFRRFGITLKKRSRAIRKETANNG